MSDSYSSNEDFELGKNPSCEKIVHQKSKINLPFSVKPFAITGRIETKCCGTPSVSVIPNIDCKDICHYLITQEICVEFPIKFGAITDIKETDIECKEIQVGDSEEG